MEEHCFIIAYDLVQPERDYTKLYSAIKSYPIWGKLTESVWGIVTNKTHIEIRDYLSQFIDQDDRLIVIQSGRNAAWTNVIANNTWVKNNLIK